MRVTINRTGPSLWEVDFISPGRQCTLSGTLKVKTEPGVELTRNMAEALVRRYREPAIRYAIEIVRSDDAEPKPPTASKVRAIR
jgi:hypothetical protein